MSNERNRAIAALQRTVVDLKECAYSEQTFLESNIDFSQIEKLARWCSFFQFELAQAKAKISFMETNKDKKRTRS